MPRKPSKSPAKSKNVASAKPSQKQRVSAEKTSPQKSTGYQVTITLQGIQASIWRRLHLPDCTLDQLHEHIQTSMGWTNSHLHQFRLGDQKYADPQLMEEDFAAYGYKNSLTTLLSDLVTQGKRKVRLQYEYDFGDSWLHEVVIEPLAEPVAKAECVAGARACPPEDCGSTPGYFNLCAIIADPKHEQHKDMLEWLGGKYDPEEFDPKAATKAMRNGLPNWRG